MPADINAPPPFFIVGSGRSGSTLLRIMLASHSRIAIPPETWFLLPLVEEIPIDRVLNTEELARAIVLMTSDYRWPDMQMSVDELKVRASHLVEPRMRDLVELVYATQLRASGKARWGDKTGPYVKIIPQLSRLFPGARFIFLVRDGRDVTKSWQNLMRYGISVHQNAIEWTEASRWERKWSASKYADTMLCVRYEDLVLDPEPTLRRICDFIGEQFEPQMLAWQQKVEHLVPSRERHIHSKLARSMSDDDVERWRREMSGTELFVAEALMQRDLRRFGYACHFRSPFWRPLLWITRVYYDFYLPVNPMRAVRVLVRLFRKLPLTFGGAAHSAGGTGDGPGGSEIRGPGPRAVSATKIRWRGYVR